MPRRWIVSSSELRPGSWKVNCRWKIKTDDDKVAIQEKLADNVENTGRDLTRKDWRN